MNFKEKRVLKREKNERRAIERKIEINEWHMNHPKLKIFLNSVKLSFKKIREYLDCKQEVLWLLGFTILSLPVGSFLSKLTTGNSFKIDECNISPKYVQEGTLDINSNGNIDIENMDLSTQNLVTPPSYLEKETYYETENELRIYSPWSTSETGNYQRSIEVYSLGTKTLEELLLSNATGLNNLNMLKELLGNPIDKKTETKDELSDTELSQNSHMEYTLYNINNNESITIRETVAENVRISMPCIILTILCLAGLISTISIGLGEDDIRYERIIEKFIEENPVELQKILEYLNVEKEELLSQLADIKNNPQQKVKKIS